MAALLHKGENVRHNKKAEWGVGEIISVHSCGTIRVVFEGNMDVSIAKGSNFLTKEKGEENGNKKITPKK
ncbi:MAG: DUF3553 domain-containing protein [Proteobacteria bacterium]|nr:DUF3553 domain-containing protein [Pseudomonadota bacterium]